MASLKPVESIVKYGLVFYEGTFKNDGCGFDSSTPFPPVSVGDYIARTPDIPAIEGKSFRVTAVRHSIRRYEPHDPGEVPEIVHYTEVCIEPPDKEEP